MSLIIGLDPGSRFAGYGVLAVDERGQPNYRDHGILELPSRLEFAARLHLLYEKLNDIFLKWSPVEVVVEKFFLGQMWTLHLSWGMLAVFVWQWPLAMELEFGKWPLEL